MTALGALSLVLLSSSPAGATSGNHGTATGTGTEDSITTGTDFGSSTNPFCLEVTASSYHVDVTGEFWAEDSGGAVSYNGDATITYTTTATYYISPQGIYTGLWINPVTLQTECDPGTLGDPVAVNVTVSDPGAPTDAGITCTTAAGDYSRVNTTITVEWSQACTVDGDGTAGSKTSPTVDHSFVGNFDPLTGITGIWTYSD